MLMSRRVGTLLGIGLLIGCSGKVRTTSLDPKALATPGWNKDGVVFYPPAYAKLTYEFTVQVDENGKFITDKCHRLIEKTEMVLLPDLGRPMLIENASGNVSSAKFGVSLNNGMLTSINVEPTEKASDLITAVAPLLSALVPGAASGTKNRNGTADTCNASPKLVRIERDSLQ